MAAECNSFHEEENLFNTKIIKGVAKGEPSFHYRLSIINSADNEHLENH